MNNEIGFFLNLDQGAMSDEQVVAMLARNGYQCIEYALRHLNPQIRDPRLLQRFDQKRRVRACGEMEPTVRAGGNTENMYQIMNL